MMKKDFIIAFISSGVSIILSFFFIFLVGFLGKLSWLLLKLGWNFI